MSPKPKSVSPKVKAKVNSAIDKTISGVYKYSGLKRSVDVDRAMQKSQADAAKAYIKKTYNKDL